MTQRAQRAQRAPQQGFTLIELMVVVAILSVLAASATALIDTSPSAADLARRVASGVAEASRKAVAGGPVDGAVIAAEGSRARTQLYIASQDGTQYAAVALRMEDGAGGSNWHELSRTWVPDGLEIYGVEPGVTRLSPGGSPEPLGGDDFALDCRPDATCDAATLYLRSTRGASEHIRVVVMPLAAAPVVLGGW